VLEKLLDEECDLNGPTYLVNLLVDDKFLRAVAGLCLEVNLKIPKKC
jgi:hypothetical protein